MECMEKLLVALADCGEAAAFYQGQHILLANRLFAVLLERPVDDFRDMPIVDICHEESIELVQDFIRRRIHGDHDVPTTYRASFRTPTNPKLELQVTVLKTKHTHDAFLAIVQEKT